VKSLLRFYFLFWMCLAVCLTSCGRKAPPRTTLSWRGKTMGTTYGVKVVTLDPDKVQLEKIQEEVEAELVAVNEAMSTWLPESEISRFNKMESGLDMEISGRFAQVMVVSEGISQLTGGAFDPTLGPLIDLWGFGAGEPRENDPSDEEIEAAMAKVGMAGLELTETSLLKKKAGIELNLSAVAKGYGVDQVASVLETYGHRNYYVEIGGEVRCEGLNESGVPWNIGIQVPVAESGMQSHRIVSVLNRALATSGDYRIFFETEKGRRHHILDPRTGRPAEHTLASVSVLAADCMTADAVATALYVMGTSEGMAWMVEHPALEVEALFIDRTESGFKLTATPGFQEVILEP